MARQLDLEELEVIRPIGREVIKLDQRVHWNRKLRFRLKGFFCKAFTNLGRILKTLYIVRYLTDSSLRQMVQLQLNKGEYRHKLLRRVFFVDQAEFTTVDYEEMMNKARCLS